MEICLEIIQVKANILKYKYCVCSHYTEIYDFFF